MKLLVLIIIVIIILILFRSTDEGICVAPKNPNHCPQGCSPFLYPDMYSPQSSCSNPFNWGELYTTGRCPQKIEQFDLDTAPYLNHGLIDGFPEPKYADSRNYSYGYNW